MGSKPTKSISSKKKYNALDIIGEIKAGEMKRMRGSPVTPDSTTLLDPKLTTKDRMNLKQGKQGKD